MRASYVFFWIVWLTIALAFITTGFTQNQREKSIQKESFEIKSYSFNVYRNFPLEKLNKSRGYALSENVQAYTDMDKNVWIDLSRTGDRTEFLHTCNHEILHNKAPYVDHSWIYENEDKVDYEICRTLLDRVQSSYIQPF